MTEASEWHFGGMNGGEKVETMNLDNHFTGLADARYGPQKMLGEEF